MPFPGYQLLRLRGRGGFATVWETQAPDGRHIALKFMSSHNSTSTVRELRALRAFTKLNHNALLPIESVWSIPGQIVIGMELAEASLLDMMLLYAEEFNRPIEPTRLLRYMTTVAEGLDFLNTRSHQWDGRTVGFQHGDVKPNNILLINDCAKLADYGMATPTNGAKTPCHRHGTLEYVAPEVVQGYVAETSDQFSLAVTYCLLRTTRFPYPPPVLPEHQVKNLVRPAPDLSGFLPEERTILSRALSTIPQDRFPSCQAFISALSRVHRVATALTVN
jgi:serine/threonine protein kinase